MEHVANYKVINIIPPNYEGDPHNALGYAWQKLVMRDYKVVREESIPGDDRIGYDQFAAAQQEVASAHPDVQWAEKMSVPVGATRVASITCMWCGGESIHGYVGGKPPAKAAIVGVGEEPTETAAIIRERERILLAELDADNAQHPGWCTKCHSYCYGDCTANR
ncbi:MAG: hypothetical protein LBV49_04225 [Azonexus sp.]|jgi:hypothetical protein|nr:hypothetical protein [Azonexus sp.]